MGRTRGSCRLVSPRVSPGQPWCRGHCRPSCPNPARASSSSAPDETGNLPRRSWNTRSNCSPPTWKTAFVRNYQRKRSSHSNDLFIKRFMLLRGIAPGLTFSANAEVMDRLWSGQSIAVHIVYFHAIITHTCDEGPGHSWIVGRVNWFMQHILYTRKKEHSAHRVSKILVLFKCIGFLYISTIPALSWSCTYIEKKVQWKSKWPLVQMKSSQQESQ